MTNLYSLKGNRNFRRLKRSTVTSSKYFSLRWLVHRHDPLLQKERVVFVGIVITKKVGKSVVRNRIRRRLREALKAILIKETLYKKYVDIIIIVKPEATTANFWQLKNALNSTLHKASLL